ncbi:MAG TPA: DUF2336 domain-containing protein [Xanthobacteraceae bacterium]|jgi:uncharacterized protein (DUF2336 family)|nr:DUF2336 domain-containing protein [Xanthobacteraceae bacterium]
MPLKDTSAAIPVAGESAAQGASSAQLGVIAPATKSLIDELEDAIAHTDLRHRAAVMRRLTDLFIMNGTGFSEEHIAMFDEVMSRLVAAIDSSARAEFGDLIAKNPRAPAKTTRLLALDDEIKVAGPILSHSKVLDEATLIEGAKTKSQDHLYAISLRDSIGEAVTDVLLERGDTEVVRSAAKNPGARFSEFGHTTLVTRSRQDGELALRVWTRADIPRQHLLSLFASASEDVQMQLEAADRQKVQLYRYLVAQAKSQIQTSIRENSASYAQARPFVEELHRTGALDGEMLAKFAQAGKFDEVTVALSLLCDLPVGHVERAIVHHRADHLMVLAKAIGLSWETTRAILRMRGPSRSIGASELEANAQSFAKLQQKTAVSAMNFYRLRARAEAQLESAQ